MLHIRKWMVQKNRNFPSAPHFDYWNIQSAIDDVPDTILTLELFGIMILNIDTLLNDGTLFLPVVPLESIQLSYVCEPSVMVL